MEFGAFLWGPFLFAAATSADIRGFRVDLSLDVNPPIFGTTCFTDESTRQQTEYDITCPAPVAVRYIRVIVPKMTRLLVGELEIYSCADYWYGDDCDKLCNCRELSEVCNKIDGSCPYSGCRDGFRGTDCQVCELNRWGLNCASRCGDNCAGAGAGDRVCDVTDGRCVICVHPGYALPDCEVCKLNRWGLNCANRCGDNCARTEAGDRVCDVTDGSCDRCVHPGYALPDCEGCVDYWYGDECDQHCNCRYRSEVCNKTNGSCPVSGYPEGVDSTDCQETSYPSSKVLVAAIVPPTVLCLAAVTVAVVSVLKCLKYRRLYREGVKARYAAVQPPDPAAGQQRPVYEELKIL